MNGVENYGRFYALLKRLPGADKETLVLQFTDGRTEHLRQMTDAEYDRMCRAMEQVACYDERREAMVRAMRRARSTALHQMQRWGVDTSDWGRVDAFCQDRRIAGKRFRDLTQEELERLTVRLRMMRRKKEEKKKR